MEESARLLERAIADGEQLILAAPDERAVETLLSARWHLARLRATRADYKGALSLVQANRLILNGMVRDSRETKFKHSRILAHIDLERGLLSSWPEPNKSEGFATADALDPVRKLASPESARMTVDAWESLADQALRALTPAELNSTDEPEVGLKMIIWLERMANQHRKPGQLDLARAITTRMQAFASKLAAHYPDEPSALLALSLVFDAIAESELLTSDRAAVEKNWTLGLAKAREAMLLAPEDKRARAETVKLYSRLHAYDVRKNASTQ